MVTCNEREYHESRIFRDEICRNAKKFAHGATVTSLYAGTKVLAGSVQHVSPWPGAQAAQIKTQAVQICLQTCDSF